MPGKSKILSSSSLFITMSANSVLDGFSTVQDVLSSERAISLLSKDVDEHVITSIRVGDSVYDETAPYSEGENDHFFIGDIYSEKERRPYAFIEMMHLLVDDNDAPATSRNIATFRVDDGPPVTSTVHDDEGLQTLMRPDWGYHVFNEKLIPFLMSEADDACFGDVLEEETRVDHEIRRGMDIALQPLLEERRMKMDVHFMKLLRRTFSKFSGHPNVRIKPYKINFYEDGDHFSSHSDSPEDGLIGTIVYHLDGQYGCFKINDDVWTRMDGDMIMFFPETSHEVTPVSGQRWTMTFKVFAPQMNADFKYIPEKVKTRINLEEDQFGVLLNNGYSYIGVKTVNDLLSTLKGVDRTIFNDLRPLIFDGWTLSVVPVLVKDREVVDTIGGYYHSDRSFSDDFYESGDECDENGFVSINDSYQRRKIIDEGEKKFKGRTSDIGDSIEVYNVSEELLEMINANIDNHSSQNDDTSGTSDMFSICQRFTRRQVSWRAPKIPVYYLGSGYHFFQIDERGIHIGNQSTGWVLDQIYFNFMLVYKRDE